MPSRRTGQTSQISLEKVEKLTSLEKEKTELSSILHRIGAIEFGAFKLTSGRTSPYYIDLRIVPSSPEAFRRVCDIYVKMVETQLGAENFDRIAGIPTAGIPFAALIAYQLKKPFLYIRSKAKLHGRERKIEGILMPGNRVLLVDDLITTGLSLKKAARAIRSEGGVVTDAVVLLNREEGGKERLKKDKITLHYLLTAREAANKLYELGAIEEDQYKTIMKQAKKK
jgi:orotate phosphoribosyltransferase